MKIYGAGMAGLLAANMLRHHQPIIREQQSELPNNHAALLRFRTESASEATGIPFKGVTVTKNIADVHIVPKQVPQEVIGADGKKTRQMGIIPDMQVEFYDKPTIPHMNQYSQKVTGKILNRSISNMDPVKRFVSPPNFISKMAGSCNIEYDAALTLEGIIDHKANGEPIISTIPMPALMKIVGWKDAPEFEHNEIWSVVADIENPVVDVYQTFYIPGGGLDYYRISFTGNHLIIECIKEPEGLKTPEDIAGFVRIIIAKLFGFVIEAKDVKNAEVKHQYYGKLMPCDEKSRKEFVVAMTDEYGIYSLGRFATWRQLLLDDIVGDVKVIKGFVEAKDNYSRSMHAKK